MRKIKIVDWFKKILFKPGTTVNFSEYRADLQNNIAIEAFALFTAVEMIAALISKCEFKVYQNNKELKGYEWYALNVKPNKNQNSTAFWQEAVSKLLYYSEVLIIEVNGQMIIADDFCKEEFAVKETEFTQVTRGSMTFVRKYKMSDVLYLKYTNSDVKGIISNIFDMYEKLIAAASDKYIKSGGQKGTLEVPANINSMIQDFEKKYEELINNNFKTYFESKNAVLPLFGGMKFTPSVSDSVKKSVNEITDISKLADEAMSRAAQAFKIPPALVRGDVAGISDAVDMMLTACIDPLADMISEELTGKKFLPEDVMKGNYIRADTTCIKHIDIFSIASNADKAISCGLLSPDEAREKVGLIPTGKKHMQKHYITKNYTVPEGGEESE